MGPFPTYLRFRQVLLAAILLLLAAYLQGLSWWIYAIIIFAFSVVSYLGTTQIGSHFYMPTYCKASEHPRKEIAISFDDGVSNASKSKVVLDILKKYQIPATFFCIGKNLQSTAQIEVLKRMHQEGHIIGNHSYSHSNFFDFYSSQTILQEIQKTDAIIQEHIGQKPLFFRPPYGITTPNIAKAIVQLKHKTIGWSIRSLDTVIADEQLLLKRVSKQLKPGAIVLFHDHLEQHASFLPLFLEYLLKEGYTVVGIDQLLQLPAYE